MNIAENPQMHELRPNNKGTKVLFENPILEKLSRTNSFLAISIFVISSIGLLIWAFLKASIPLWQIFSVYLLGLLAFTFAEYLIHRYVFHMITDTETKAKIQYTMHGIHHEFPRDKERLAMPPVLSIIISASILAICYLIFKNIAFPLVGGFLLGYASYLFVHYAVHAYAPPKNFLKVLWVNHSVHHYKDHDIAFGVSSPLWDYIFGTFPKKEKQL